MSAFQEFRRIVEGQLCRALLVQEFSYRGELAATVTVLFLQFGEDRWARFGIDAGDLHWREVAAATKIENTEPDYDYPLRNLSAEVPVIGQRIRGVVLRRIAPLHVVLRMEFESGAALLFTDLDDRSQLQFCAGSV